MSKVLGTGDEVGVAKLEIGEADVPPTEKETQLVLSDISTQIFKTSQAISPPSPPFSYRNTGRKGHC